MVKIAFNSPFALKDEPKKEAAEALVADKVRAPGCPGRRRREERGGVRGGARGDGAAAIFWRPGEAAAAAGLSLVWRPSHRALPGSGRAIPLSPDVPRGPGAAVLSLSAALSRCDVP